MIDEKTRIDVENVGRGSVSYRPETNPALRRRWEKPGIIKKIPFGEIQEMLTTTGGRNLFTGMLLIKDLKAREELDLSVAEEALTTDADLGKLLVGNPTKLKETMPKLHPELQKRLAEKAVEVKLDNITKINIIKEQTGIDVYQLIKNAEETKKA
jgi:hypothetical protein